MDTVLIFLTFVLILIVILSIVSFGKYTGRGNRNKSPNDDGYYDELLDETKRNIEKNIEKEYKQQKIEDEYDKTFTPRKFSDYNVCEKTKKIKTLIGEICDESKNLDRNDVDNYNSNIDKYKYKLRNIEKILR